MAAPWDIVGRAANLVQLFGLDAVTLIAIATSFLQLRDMNEERRKLEDRERMLRALLTSPAGRWIMTQQQQQHTELGRLVTEALQDARLLVQSYTDCTVLVRVRRGRSFATRFRTLRGSIDCYCRLILSINAGLAVVQAKAPPLLPTPVRSFRSIFPPSSRYIFN